MMQKPSSRDPWMTDAIDWTLEDSLEFDLLSEIDGVIASRPEFDLEDDPSGCVDSQSCFGENISRYNRNFDLTLDGYDATSILVDPNVVIPSHFDRTEWQFKVPNIEPEEERYIKTEPPSPVNSQFDDDGFEPTTPWIGDRKPATGPLMLASMIDNFDGYDDDVQQPRCRIHVNLNCDDKVYSKPAYSYTDLCGLALNDSRTGALFVTDIYKFICENFPYFNTAPQGWKNSVRHTLSKNECFVKIKIKHDHGGRCRNLWTIDPAKDAKMTEVLEKKFRECPLDVKSLVHESSGDYELCDVFVQDHDYLPFPRAKRRKTMRTDNVLSAGGEWENAAHLPHEGRRCCEPLSRD